jgi:predicted TPR repeat methyltransferase
VSDPIARARAIEGSADAVALYREWAASYDRDVFGERRFTGSQRIAAVAAEFVSDRSARVLDIGCGTGAVGQHLRQAGFDRIDGVDISPEMLAIAAATSVYGSLTVLDLNAPPFDLGSYDVMVSAGTFTSGHVGPDAVAPLLHSLAPEGTIVWAIAAVVWPMFEPTLTTSPLTVLYQQLEPVREGGAAESIVLVARSDGR